MIDKLVLGPFLEVLGRLVAQHLLVGVVFIVGLGLLFATVPFFQRRICSIVAGHDGAFPGQCGLLECRPEAVCLIDASRYQHGVTPALLKCRNELEILDNLGNYTINAILA